MRHRTLRILHLTTSFPQSRNDFSGLFVWRLVQALEKRGAECLVSTPAGLGSSDWPTGNSVKRFRYAPRSWQRVAQQPGGIPQALSANPALCSVLPLLLLSMAGHLALLARHCDLIHAHWSICGAVAVLTQPFHGKPVVTTLRGSDTHRAAVSGPYAWIHRTAVRGSRITFGVSRHIVSNLQQTYPDISNRFLFVPNGVGEDFYAIPCPGHAAPPPVRFLFVGSLIPLKGVDFLLRALASPEVPKEWSLSIAGDGPEMSHLVSLAQTTGLSDRVTFINTVPPERMASVMAEHHVLVLPSLREGRPNIVLEAMAAGLPVLGTNIAGIRELVQQGLTGWLAAPGNYAALAQELGALIRGERNLAAAGIAGRRWMLSQGLTWNNSAERYLTSYREALLQQQTEAASKIE